MAASPAVRAADVHVTLGGVRVLHGVSADVAAGETVALMGANGSGKTTLVRAIIGAIEPTAGRIEIGGAPLSRSARAQLGYVPQRVSASSGVAASALEVVETGLLGAGRLRPGRGSRAQAREALAAVGLADRGAQDVATLSGGQQQRVLIARALVRDPDVLLLDEPLAGVDVASQELFAHTLERLKADGRTMLIVLHEAGPLAPLLDRAVVLENGCVVHDGPVPTAHGVHALPGHDHVHPHGADPHDPSQEAPSINLRGTP